MKSGTLWLAVVFSLLVAPFCLRVSDAGAEGNVFSGRVVDEDGKPLHGVKVVAWNWSLADGPLGTEVRWETMSAADGSFKLHGLGPGVNNVVFLKEGLFARSRNGDGYVGSLLFPRSGGAKEGVEVCMERPELVSGTVADESGSPVAGAEVSTGTYVTVTATDGSFKIPAAVAQHAGVTAPGYRRCPGDYQPDADEPWTITLTKGIVVSGRVLDAATGKPVEGALLFRFGGRAKTASGPNGRYRLDQLHPTRTEVLVWKDDLIAKVTFDLYDGKSLDAADILLDKGGTIEGRITDKETGQPLEGVPVSLWGIDPSRRWLFARQTTTGPDGRYRITGVLSCNMNVVPDQFRTGGENFYGCVCAHVEPGELVAGVDFQIDAPPDPQSVPRITGRVVDDNGDPVPSAMLFFLGPEEPDSLQFMLLTDITGDFSTATMTYSGQPLALETDKPYTIEVLGPLLAPKRLENVLIPGETSVKQLTVTLQNGARMTGTVRGLDGQPIADVAILACATEQAIVEDHKLRPKALGGAPRVLGAVTNQDGTYEMPGLARGTWVVGIFPQKCLPTNGPYQIQVEDEKPVAERDFTARLLRTGSIEGTVADENGAPLPHAEVEAQCHEPLRISRSVWTDAQGLFRFDSVPEAEYRLSAERGDGYAGSIENAKIGASDIVITARSGTSPKDGLIHGRVVDVDGKPITQFKVECPINFWWATYHSPSGKFAALMTSVERLSVSALGYETKDVQPNGEAIQGSEILIVLEGAGS